MNSDIFLFSKTPYSTVKHIPIIDTQYLSPSIEFTSYDYIVASSKEVFNALDKIGQWRDVPILAISEPTAQAAKAIGAKVLDTAQGNGKSFVELITKKYADKKGLYPHAKVVAYDLEDALKRSSIKLDSYAVYETICTEISDLFLPKDAICIFTSPSSIQCFQKQFEFLPSYKIVCIGKTTASALPEGVSYTLSKNPSIESTIACAKDLIK